MKTTFDADAATQTGSTAVTRSLATPALSTILGGLRRRWPLVALTSLLGLASGLALIATQPSTYTATSSISTEQQRVRVIQDAYTFSGEEGGYESDAGTQVELMRSTRMAALVAEAQGLTAKPVETAAIDSSRLNHVLSNFGLDSIAERVSPRLAVPDAGERLINELRSGLSVRRIPRTSIIEVSYTSNDPQHAARLSNAFSEAFIEYHKRRQAEAAKSAASWLRERLAELKGAVQETEQSIQSYKERRGFVAAEGRLIEEQRLAEANRQLVAAQSETSNARVRFTKLQSAAKLASLDAVPAEFLVEPAISQLRNRFLQVDMGERSLSNKLGSRHEAVLRMRQQKSDVEKQLRSELERIASSLHGQIELAQAREEAIRREYQELARLTTKSNEAQIELRELERRNDAYKGLYGTILQKYQSAVNQQTLTEAPARIVNRAVKPSYRNGPGAARVVTLGLLLGFALGGGLVVAATVMEGTLRTRAQAMSRLGVERAWLLPPAPADRLIVTGESASQDGATERRLRPRLAALLHAQRNPGSYFAGTLDAIRLEIAGLAGDRAPKIGVVALLDDESSSIVAKNLASLTAATGARTLLIDADLGNAGLSHKAAPDAGTGLAAAILKLASVDDLLLTEAETDLRMLPAVAGESARRPADLLSSSSLRTLLDHLSAENDLIVIDMPTIGHGVDAQALLPLLDAVILVVAWGRTHAAIVADALDHTPGLADKCFGVVLFGADTHVARQYGETDVRSRRRRRHR